MKQTVTWLRALRAYGGWISLLWVVLAVALVLMLVQSQSGIPASKTYTFEKDQVLERAGHRVKLRLSSAYRTDMASRLVRVFEDGRPLPLRIDHLKRLEQLGMGRYCVRRGTIHLSATDNSTPFDNGRVYSAKVPRSIHRNWLWGAFLATLLVSVPVLTWPECRRPFERVGEWVAEWAAKRPVTASRMAAILFVIGVAAGVWEWRINHSFSDGWFTLKGAPYSDAMGWNENAISLKQGRGFVGAFRGHRGGYPLFLGSLYSIFGESLAVAKMSNVVLFSAGCAFVYLFFAAAGLPWLGVASWLWCLCDPGSRSIVHRILTENLAFALIPASMYFLLCGFRRGERLSLAVSGALLGFSNLSRPLTLFAVLFHGVIFAALYLRRREEGWDLAAAVRRGLCYSAGLLVVMFPWCLRQKLSYDTWSPSANSTALLYGGAMTKGHSDSVNAAHFREPLKEAGIPPEDIGATAAYFARRYREVVSDDPVGYAKRIVGNVAKLFELFRFEASWQVAYFTVLGCAMLFGRAWQTRQPWLLLLIPGAVFLLPYADAVSAWVLVFAGAALLLLLDRRVAWAIAVATIAGSGMLAVLVGNFGLDRSRFLLFWIFAAIALGILWLVLRLISRAQKRPQAAPALKTWNPFATAAAAGLALTMAPGLTVIGIRNLVYSDKPWDLPGGLRQEFRQEVSAKLDGLDAADPRFFVEVVRMNDYRFVLPGQRDAGHLVRASEVRDEDRTVAFPRLLTGARRNDLLLAGQFLGPPEKLPRRGDYVLIGLENWKEDTLLDHSQTVIEGLALIPFDTEAGVARTEDVIRFEPGKEVQRLLLQSAGKRYR